MRDSFTIYRNTLEALESLPPDVAVKILSYIGHYAMDDKEPNNEEPISYAFFCQIKPLIDKNKIKAEAGRQGGEANRKQTEANVKQTEANGSKREANKKEEIRKEKGEIINNNILSGKPASEYPYKEVIDYLNTKAGKQFKDKSKDTRKHIKARFDEGATLDDFHKVIDNMTAKWRGDPKMDDYLRPATLFGSKFESYLNVKTDKTSKVSNFTPRNNDYDALERELLLKQAGMM